MKAIIEFEIEDLDNAEETKQKLVQYISEELNEWLKGKGIINLKFITNDKSNANYTKINWITNNSNN